VKFPLFVLVGDSFLCEEKRGEILSLLEKEFGPPLPVVIQRAGEAPVADLLAEARTLPFLARAQVFCLREADRFTKGDIALWGDYLGSPAPRTFFIFETESLAKGHPFLDWAARAKQLFLLETQSGRMAVHFIREKLRRAGKKMTPEALTVLEERLGTSFGLLDTFLDQLILSVGEKAEIDRSAVEASEERLFRWEGQDLVKALAEKKAQKALEALEDLLEQSSRDFPSARPVLRRQSRSKSPSRMSSNS